MTCPSKSHPNHPTYREEARPKVSAKSSAGWPQLRTQSRPKDEPDPVNHPHRWIHAEMEVIHPHWLKELKASGRVSKGAHLIKEGSAMLKPHYRPVGRQLYSGCPWPNMWSLAGGMLHPSSVDCTPWISCPTLMPLAQGISRLCGRKRPYP